MDDRVIWNAVTNTWSPLFLLVTSRLAGMLALSPWWDDRVISRHWRWILVVLLSLLITPGLAANTGEVEQSAILRAGSWPAALLQEVALGAVTGLALRLVFAAVAWTVHLVGPLSGLSLNEVFEPATEGSAAPLGQLLKGTAIAVWFGVGGHRQALAALLDTFQIVPVGTARFDASTLTLLVELLTSSCLAGIRAALPVLAVLLACWLVVSGIARLMPRGTAWVWSASLASIVGLVGICLTLGYMTTTYAEHFAWTLTRVPSVWNSVLDTETTQATP